MCTLAVFRDVCDAYPLIVAANRDEFYARPSQPPRRLHEDRAVVAGRDLEAGGTWLGVRTQRSPFVAALLNRRTAGGSEPSRSGPRSRGRLCLDVLLGAGDVQQALTTLETAVPEVATAYGAFNLLLADAGRCVVVDNGGGVLHRAELDAGLSVLTNLEVNDGRCPRLANASKGFGVIAGGLRRGMTLDDAVEPMREVLADHANRLDAGDESPFSRICVHTDVFGTRCSSLIALAVDGRVRYFHCEGPPCRSPLRELVL